jgi:hypothetical protein
MQSQHKCIHCGSQRVTPPTNVQAAAGFPYLIYKTPGGGFFDQGVRLAWEGCACLDCGYVMTFLVEQSLAEARQLQSFIRWS